MAFAGTPRREGVRGNSPMASRKSLRVFGIVVAVATGTVFSVHQKQHSDRQVGQVMCAQPVPVQACGGVVYVCLCVAPAA